MADHGSVARLVGRSVALWLSRYFGCSPVMTNVPVLFTRRDSVYKQLPYTDCYDEDRDALSYNGNRPVIAHPPCRGWGRLRSFSNHTQAELDLARWAVGLIRRVGGVLEHPYGSALWEDQRLPGLNQRDPWGGFTLPVFQHWFGHKAAKPTLLYIVGIDPEELPLMPFTLAEPEYVVAQCSRMPKELRRPEISKAEREHTPLAFAQWLCILQDFICIAKRLAA